MSFDQYLDVLGCMYMHVRDRYPNVTLLSQAMFGSGIEALAPQTRLACAKVTASNPRRASEGWWAHQDSNLERAGYEPAALTIELWARTNSQQRSTRKPQNTRSVSTPRILRVLG